MLSGETSLRVCMLDIHTRKKIVYCITVIMKITEFKLHVISLKNIPPHLSDIYI